jgi:GMP synthase (glutamine-hydrolysing)
MDQDILILRNIPRESPGIIEDVLKEFNLTYQIIDFDHTTYQKIEKYKALIVLGGPESANDQSQKMLGELDFIRKAIQSDIPCLGICLGLQTFVKTLDGKVVKCPAKEVGFRDPDNQFYKVKLTPEGRADKFFNNLPDVLTVFQLHGETVQITPKMKLLATGDFCKNQIVKFGNKAYGIQFHFELTDSLLESWVNEDNDLKTSNIEQILSDFKSIKTIYQRTGRQLFINFLIISGLVKC